MLIDSHCHFDFEVFNANRSAIWQRARAAGVSALILPGVEPQQWPTLARLCEQNSHWYFAVGIHPWWYDSVFAPHNGDAVNADLKQNYREQINQFTQHPKCVAIGECGLDATRTTPLDMQMALLQWHCELAIENHLPLITHCVKAHNALLSGLNKYKNISGVVHGFSGSVALANEYWRRNFLLGVGGTITYGRASKTRNTLTQMPIDSLLLETDAPDMPLSGKQGQANSPEYLPEIAQQLALLKQKSLNDIEEATVANTLRLFNRIQM